MNHFTPKPQGMLLAFALASVLGSCEVKPTQEEDSNNVISKFNSTWNIHEKCLFNEDGSITYDAIPWGGLVGTFKKNNMPVDLTGYESITFDFAEPTTVPTQVVVANRFKTWAKEGITSLTCNFDGQDVTSVDEIVLQTGDSNTLKIRHAYLTPNTSTWTSVPIWQGNCAFGQWENGFVIKPEKFEQAYEGDKLEFVFKADTTDPSVTYWLFKTIYSGTDSTLKGNDFELNKFGCAYVAPDATIYRIVLTGEDVANLREKGIFVNGYHLIVSQCNLLSKSEPEDY